MIQKKLSKIGVVVNVYELEFKFDVHFFFQTSRIYSVTQKEFEKIFPNEDDIDLPDDRIIHGVYIPVEKKRESEFGYLVIESTYNLNQYDSLNQGAVKIRPDIIIILGIISFLTNKALIPAQSFYSKLYVVKRHISSKNSKIVTRVYGDDLSAQLKKILLFILQAEKEKQVLFYTILERWRKALYLEQESEEGDIFIDESVLAYMHVLEVLSDEFKVTLDKQNKVERKRISEEIIKCAQNSAAKPKDIIRLVNVLDNTRVSLKAKIIQLLVSFDLDCPKAQRIVERFIEHRNAIAHGRKNLYQERLVFPLPQFFSFIKDIDEDVELIKILAARCIAKLFGIELWKNEWEFKLLTEVVTFEFVQKFLDDQIYKQINYKDFIQGKIDTISPNTLSFYYRKGKVNLQTLELALTSTIIDSTKNEEEYQELFESAVVLADSLNEKLASKCKEIVKTVYKEKWFYYSNIRDVIKNYEYHEIKLIWFGAWLVNKG